MIETRHLNKLVFFIQTILNFVLPRKIMCKVAVKKSSFVIKYFSGQYKTKQMRDKVIKIMEC